jgi:ubiquinol-cytochrome c reductase iron-sulfur subunit
MTPPEDPNIEGQTSAEAAGSIRDRLSSPRPSSEANSGGDDSRSSVSEQDFRNTDSAAALHSGATAGTGERQQAGGGPPRPSEDIGPHKAKLTPAEARSAERKVSALFVMSFLAVIAFVLWYFLAPFQYGEPGYSLYTPGLGLLMGIALFGVGAGAVLWAKLLMVDEESVQERHPFGSPPEERSATAAALKQGYTDTGLPGRRLLLGTLALGAGSLALLPIPLLFGLGRWQHKERILATTDWTDGMRLIRTNGTAVRVGDLQLGAIESVFPDVPHGERSHDGAALLIRMRPEELVQPAGQEDWAFQGHVVYSSICTHLGCPVKLYEQRTHHLFCPCHQSTFDASRGADVIFGPAARPLPQLAIAVDDEGYFIARGDFSEPTGPSYWERPA